MHSPVHHHQQQQQQQQTTQRHTGDRDEDADVQQALLLSLQEHVHETLLPLLRTPLNRHKISATQSKITLLLEAQRDPSTVRVLAESSAATQVLLALLQDARGDVNANGKTDHSERKRESEEQLELKRQALRLLACGCVGADDVLSTVVRLLQENQEAFAKAWHQDANHHLTFTALLLNFVRTVHDAHVIALDTAAGDLARALVHIIAAKSTVLVDILALDLLSRAATARPKVVDTATQDAVAAILTTNLRPAGQPFYSLRDDSQRPFDRQRWDGVRLWTLGSALPQTLAILRDGCAAEQYVVLKCLLATPRTVRERLVLLPDAVAALVGATTVSEHNVSSLAVELVRDVARCRVACRAALAAFLLRCSADEYASSGCVLSDALLIRDNRDNASLETTVAPDANDTNEMDDVMLTLRNGADDDERVRLLRNIVTKHQLLLFMSYECDLLSVCFELVCSSRASDDSDSDSDSDSVSIRQSATSEGVRAQLWRVLCTVVTHASSYYLVPLLDVKRFAQTALAALRAECRDARLAIAEMLASYNFQCEHPSLLNTVNVSRAFVAVLAQEPDAAVATVLAASLRRLRASHARRVDAQLWLVCNRKDAQKDFDLRVDAPMLYQNLLAVCRSNADDRLGLPLGAVGVLDQVICAGVAAELLLNANDAEQTIILRLLYSYLRAGVPGVVSMLHENVDDLFKLAMHGPVLCKRPARQMLRALTRNGTACCEDQTTASHAGRACVQPDPVFGLIRTLLRKYRVEEDADEDDRDDSSVGKRDNDSDNDSSRVDRRGTTTATVAGTKTTSFVSVTVAGRGSSSGGGDVEGGGEGVHEGVEDDEAMDALDDEWEEEEATRQRLSSFAFDDWEVL